MTPLVIEAKQHENLKSEFRVFSWTIVNAMTMLRSPYNGCQ